MAWWAWTLIGIYVVGFVLIFIGHVAYLQMVSPSLALVRALVWPIFLATGWPHGVPMTMD